jgi:hypothetical protein
LIFKKPLTVKQAVERIQSWFDQPCIRLINPTESHWQIFQSMLLEGQAKANLVVDAHIAALAIEHGCILYSTDTDFSRFPKLKWKNPLKKSCGADKHRNSVALLYLTHFVHCNLKEKYRQESKHSLTRTIRSDTGFEPVTSTVGAQKEGKAEKYGVNSGKR